MTDYYDNYFFTSNATGFLCPDVGSACLPPRACARDSHTGQEYCCNWQNNPCWTGSVPCATDGSTVNCGSGDYTWCCRHPDEQCTQTSDQINICWNTVPSTLFDNITITQLNETYSSLVSASPSATALLFTPSLLIAATETHSSSTSTISAASSATTTGSSVSTTSHTSSSISSPTPPANSPVAHSSKLSGGAIAGIVIGVVALLALIAAGIFFFLRRRGGQNATPAAGYTPAKTTVPYQQSSEPYQQPSELYQQPSELYQHSFSAPVSELSGQKVPPRPPTELPAQ